MSFTQVLVVPPIKLHQTGQKVEFMKSHFQRKSYIYKVYKFTNCMI